MIEFIIGSISLLMAALAVGLCIYLVHIIQEEKRGRVYRRRSRKTSAPRRTKVKRQPRFNKVNPNLQNRLLVLLSGDWSTAERLVGSVRVRHPGRSEDWYWEKAIYDLQRDRG